MEESNLVIKADEVKSILEKQKKNIKANNEDNENNIFDKYCDKQVDNQFVGIIEVCKQPNGYVKWLECSLFDETRKNAEERKNKSEEYSKQQYKTLVIVLESPHSHEFSEGNPIGPACGLTGANIYKVLPNIIGAYHPQDGFSDKVKYDSLCDIENGKYKVFLLNAVPFQCSLGEDTSLFRDAIFKKIWDRKKDANGVQSFFKSELTRVNPSVIINCCTRGKSGTYLNDLVQNKLETMYHNNNKVLLLRSTHPSTWDGRQRIYSLTEWNERKNIK